MIIAENHFTRIIYYPVADGFILLTIISIIGIAHSGWKKAKQKSDEAKA
jgi:hypothetical protein